MTRILPLVLSLGCSDYEVSRIEKAEEKSWFEETSESYQDDFNPTSPSEDRLEEDDDQEDAEDVEEELDTGSWTPPQDDSEDDDAPESDDGEDDPDDDDLTTDPDPDSSPDEDPSTDSPEDHGTGTPSGGSASATVPSPGAVVITELMIYPQATDDAQGEWVELYNATGAWLDLTGSMLVDRGVDAVEIEPVGTGSLIVGPGAYLTICADADYWDNGGVSCDGTFHYWTMGGGFALSNTEDEVKLISSAGHLLDEVRYTDGFSVEGEALALDPDNLSVSANDVMGNWCEQLFLLPFGDGGTPGEPNSACF
jgi:hypothetical protein